MSMNKMFDFRVTNAPYFAKGDGKTDDRQAIQQALDDAFKNGGGRVILTAGKTFLTAGLVIKSGVELFFEDGATLLQSGDPSHYVKPAGEGYEPYTPMFGHNFSPEIKWSHCWYKNYPLIFAPEGSRGFAVRGSGTIRMMEVTDPEKIIKICPVGFYKCSDFEICDIHITNYHSYAIMPFTCENGLFRNIKITDWSYGNGDGICMMNCRNMRVTGCDMYTGDDSVYIFSSYRDPRRSVWWNSDNPQPSENIEIDNNHLRSNHCKAFGMILWGIDCPDLEKVEVRNVYVHDNYFETMGNWLWNPYSDRGGYPPVTGVRFENNRIDGIESNFFETQVSDMTGFRSMAHLQNGGFEQGRCFWAMRKNGDENSAGVNRNGEEPYGFIDLLEKGDAALYQGVYLKAGQPKLFKADVRSSGDACRLFVRSSDTGELIASLDFSNTSWEEKLLPFTVPEDGNYRIGIERGDASKGFAHIKAAVLGTQDEADGSVSVEFDRGKMIFKY